MKISHPFLLTYCGNLHHGNAFAIDEEAQDRSNAAGKLILHCYRRIQPNRFSVARWLEDWVSLEDLTYDPHEFKAYCADTEREQLRSDFEGFWLHKELMGWDDRESSLTMLKDRLYSKGVYFKTDDYRLHRGLDALYSLKHGRMVGFNYKQNPILELSHHMFDRGKDYLYLFLHALEIFGHSQHIRESDRSKSFERKVGTFKRLRMTKEYARPAKYNQLLLFLFPELQDKIR